MAENVIIIPEALQASTDSNSSTTILAYGALLSESSSRLTFPNLQNFRHVQIRNFRRLFGHPHLFLISQGMVDPQQTLNLASLSIEPIHDKHKHEQNQENDNDWSCSFVAAAYDVQLDDQQRKDFVTREAGYDICSVPFYNLKMDDGTNDNTTNNPTATMMEDGKDDEPIPDGYGVICTCSTDETYLASGLSIPSNLPIPSVWHWPSNSGLLPANIYLRHCLLAVQKAGGIAEQSFLRDTYLCDRTTTLADYLSNPNVRDEVMSSRPPPEFATRFGG